MHLFLSLLAVLTCLSGETMAMRRTKDTAEAGTITKLSFKDGDKEYPYWLYVPKNARKGSPLILFLHGSGEREGGAKGPHEVGLGPAIAKQQNFPFYVLIPQFSKKGSWKADGDDARRTMKLLDSVVKAYDIDTKRLYLTGLSMGGNGTWEQAVAYPKKWAAIAPVCGYFLKMGNGYPGLGEDKLQSIKDIPCWCFHGDKDSAVNVKQSREAMRILWAAGGHPNYTEFPGINHNCWDLTYANPELYKWFLAHQLK
jgi:predicted peptidase